MNNERKHSTVKAARLMRIAQPRLQKLIRDGRVVAPSVYEFGGVKVRFWTLEEINAAKRRIRSDRAAPA
jgi:hypothetical protein